MNNLKNKVQLIGNIGKNPELTTFDSGKQLAKTSIATNEYYKNPKGERISQTEWHNLVAWGKQAELFSKLIKKGQEVAIEGKLVTRTYETEKGEKRSLTEIHVNEFQLLGKKQPEGAES